MARQFAPQGNNEVTAIFSDRSSLIQLEDRDLSDVARGLSSVLNGYRKIGVESFNMTFFSGPNDRELSEYFLLNAKIMSRPNFRPLYTGDAGFMERFHYEPIVETMPEYVAEEIRAFFNNHESIEI
jgi:galactose-1-phosphate uridylyltransferase